MSIHNEIHLTCNAYHTKGSPTTSNSTSSVSSGINNNSATMNELKVRTKELRNSIVRTINHI